LDDRQDNLGQVSSFQASQPQRAAHEGRKSWQRNRCRPFVDSDQPIFFQLMMRAAGSASATACPSGKQRRAKRRVKNKHKMKITKGGRYDE
jgi:hypothetical protein